MAKALLNSSAQTEGDSEPGVTTKRRFSARGTFAALQYPNYRLWFFGQMFSLVGTWMQSTAQGYLVYELTGSPQYLGYVSFAAGLPSWLFMLYGGLVADRMPRRSLLMITQAAMMLLAFGMAALKFTGIIQAWMVVVMAFLLGIANAFDAPARLAFVNEMVDRKDLTNAIALNATMFNTAMAVGPAIGGLTYAAVGAEWCFILNGISYLAVITALALMHIPARATVVGRRSPLKGIQEGFRYVSGQRVVRTVILNVFMVSLFGISFVTLMPAWAVNVLGGDATTNGYLQSARGIGALAAALMLATVSGMVPKGKLITLGSFTFPVMLLIFSRVAYLPLSLLLLFGIGWGYMLFINTSNALVQTIVPDDLRGRVMSIYSLTFFGFMPIGALLAGAVAERMGSPAAVMAGALLVLVYFGLVYWRVPELRRSE